MASVVAVVALLLRHIFVKVGEQCLDGKIELLETSITFVAMLHNIDGPCFMMDCKLSQASSAQNQSMNLYSSLRKKPTKAVAIGQTQDG